MAERLDYIGYYILPIILLMTAWTEIFEPDSPYAVGFLFIPLVYCMVAELVKRKQKG